MKAPDKIYLQRVPSNQEVIDGWTVEPVKHTVLEDIEYIRKDALLEWAKKEMKEWSSESNTAQGVKMGLSLVLDKIESL